jgi:ribosomal protein S18 acetylase RimI-like enzyme
VYFREATEADWAGIWPFWHRIAVEGETYSWNPESTSDQARDDWLVRPPGRTIVGMAEDQVRASAQLQPNYGPASKIANASFIVDPEFSGRGIGRQLVTHVLDEARKDGYWAMVFNAVVETNAAAVHLYETFGFEILATVPDAFAHPTKGFVGLHIMHKRLSQG